MNVIEFFTGTEDEKAAAKRLKEIGAKGEKISWGEMKEREKLSPTLNGLRFRIVGAVAVALGLGYYGYTRSTDQEPYQPADSAAYSNNVVPESVEQSSPKSLAEKTYRMRTKLGPEQEALTDKMITKIEKGFKEFEKIVRPKIEQEPIEHIRRELEAPFVIMDRNKKNNDRNYPRLLKERQVKRDQISYLNDPYHFFYAVHGQKGGGMSFSFNPVQNLMRVPEDFDPNNYMDILILFHELKHVVYEVNAREGIRSDAEYRRYVKSFEVKPGERPRIFIDGEFSVYAFEIELLNKLLDGRLMAAAASGEKIDAKEVAQKLNARPSQLSTIEMLLHFAEAYYPQRVSAHNGFPREYVDRIARNYERAGYDIHIRTIGGGSKPYRFSRK